MDEYPKTIIEFRERFSTEEACRDYLGKLRWPNGFVCPCCQETKAWNMNRGLFWCRNCQYQASITSGTLFHDTHKPLRLWFEAMWYVINQKSGVSALGLQRALGLGSYHTAWNWLHKLRRAMVRPGRDRLSGQIEVDEVFIGGVRALTQIKRHRGKKTEGRQKGSLTHGKKTPEIGVNAHEPRTEKRVVTETPSSL